MGKQSQATFRRAAAREQRGDAGESALQIEVREQSAELNNLGTEISDLKQRLTNLPTLPQFGPLRQWPPYPLQPSQIRFRPLLRVTSAFTVSDSNLDQIWLLAEAENTTKAQQTQ
jgi:hypothetical protein